MTDPTTIRRTAREAWHQRSFVAIDPSWLVGDDRAQLTRIADKVHGVRPRR